MSEHNEEINPIPERIFLVDALRGFALMGLFLIHCIEYFELYWMNPVPSVVHDLIFFLFGGKAYAIFGMLFGLSFFIIMEKQAAKGVNFSGRFVWRLILLFAIGLLHSLIYSGDILQVLAVLGLLLLAVYRSKDVWVFILAIIFLSNFPLIYNFFSALQNFQEANALPRHWGLSQEAFKIWATGSFTDVMQYNSLRGNTYKWDFFIESGRVFQLFGLFMCGLLLGRRGFFSRPQTYSRQVTVFFLCALVIGAALYKVQTHLNQLPPNVFQKEGMAKYYLETLLDGYFSLAFMTVLVLLFVRVYQWKTARGFLNMLVPAGRMSLTLYVCQAIVCVPLFYGYGLGWYSSATQAGCLVFGIAFFAVQLLFAKWWMNRFYYGPLEWLWRVGTYMSLAIPFMRKPKNEKE